MAGGIDCWNCGTNAGSGAASIVLIPEPAKPFDCTGAALLSAASRALICFRNASNSIIRFLFFSIIPARQASVWWLACRTSVCSTARSSCLFKVCCVFNVERSRPESGVCEFVRGGPSGALVKLVWADRTGGGGVGLADVSKSAEARCGIAELVASSAGRAYARSPTYSTG